LDIESRSARGETYRLGRKLKAGSTGDIFETAHPLLAGPCAIKILRPALVTNPEALEAFRSDVEAVSALRHPNIVHLIEAGSDPGMLPFVVMELLEGRTLAERLAGGRTVPLAEAVEIVKAIAAALQAAHSRGVVHGEVNPSNVFLARVEGYEQGVVKLLNFGIARLRSVDAAALLTADTTRYLSPEQAAGRAEDVDGRSDQFALATIAYRMLSGTDIFQGETAISLLYQIVHDTPSPALTAEVGAAVEAVIRRGMAHDKWDRYETVVAFARAFESAASGEIPARATPGPSLGQPAQPPIQMLHDGHPSAEAARTMRGFAAANAGVMTSTNTAINAGARTAPQINPVHVPRQAPAPAPGPIVSPRAVPAVIQREAPVAQRPAPRTAPSIAQQAPLPRQPPPRERRSSDSLLNEPFFNAYRTEEHRRVGGDTLMLDEGFRAPRNGLKLFFFLLAVGIASFAACLAVGWRPPLTWRQTAVWNQLGLPGAAAPLAWPKNASP
jgi:serine/threonine protein kinase